MAAVLVYVDLVAGNRPGRRTTNADVIQPGDTVQPHGASLAALAAGRQVARAWGATLYAAIVVHDPTHDGKATTAIRGIDALEATLASAGADKIVVALSDAPAAPLWSSVGATWSGVLDHLRPRLVLFGADAPATPELGPRTGARIGARLLQRARAIGIDDVELRDRDGSYVRVGDSGATVALIGEARVEDICEDDVDLVVLALPGADDHVVLTGTQPAELQLTSDVVVALGDDALGDNVVAGARRLADLLGAQLVGGPAAAAAGAIPHAAAFEPNTPIAPDLCVVVGALALDLAGATTIVRIGASKFADGYLTGPLDAGLDELVRYLEDATP